MPRAARRSLGGRVGSCVLALAALCAGQSDEEIQQAVLHCIGLEEVHDAARQQLVNWGNVAMPYLERRLEEATLVPPPYEVLVASRYVGTQESIDLLVRQLEREVPYPLAMFALSVLSTRDDAHRDLLRASPRLKPILLERLRTDRYAMTLGQTVDLAVDLGWTEAAEPIRRLVDHPDLLLRKRVARALEMLAGEEVELPDVEPSFPAVDLGAVSLEPLTTIEEATFSPVLEFVTWEGEDDPHQVLLHEEEHLRYALLDQQRDIRHRLELPVPAVRLLLAPRDDGDGQQFVRVGRASRGDRRPVVAAHDRDGQLLWMYELPRAARHAEVLYHRGQACGIVVGLGGEDGVVAVDLSGEFLWRQPTGSFVRSVSTHPGLRSHVVIASETLEVLNAAGRPARIEGQGLLARLADEWKPDVFDVPLFPLNFGAETRVFPDASGHLVSILGGTGVHSMPTLGRRDARGRSVWSATVPERINGLALLEPVGHPRLVACTTEAGMVYLTTEDGTLVWQDRFAFGERVHVLATAGGRLGDATCLAIKTSEETLVYRLDTDPGR